MPHLTGVFDEFPDLDIITPEQLMLWIKRNVDEKYLVNLLGNRALYPQVIPLTKQDLEIDLAILKEAMKQKPGIFYNPQAQKLVIPETFIERFPPIEVLITAIIEGVNPKGLNQVFAKTKQSVKLIGSVLSPPKLDKTSPIVQVTIEDYHTSLKLNTISIARINAPVVKAKIRNEEFTLNGGSLGIIIDLRTGGGA